MNRPGRRIQVSDEFKDVLLEFSINYLLEQPNDVVDYASEYFEQLKKSRTTALIYEGLEEEEEEGQLGGMSTGSSCSNADDELPTIGRRNPVFAESYDPEEDDDDSPKVVYPKSEEQRERLADSVRPILLFRSLDKEQMEDVLDAMFERKVVPDEIVIQQGADGDNFYVIESGIYQAFIQPPGQEPLLIKTYENNGHFGELALLYNMPRAATIKSTTEGLLWAMDRNTFRRILLKSAFRKRKMYESLLDNVPMLKTLEPYERMNLADALVPKTFSEGEKIITEGDAADGMYFVESGSVRITRLDDNGEETEINIINAGGYFGELALVTHKQRAASAYAIGDLKVAFLDVEAFERLLGPCMQIMKRNINDYEAQIIKIFGTKHNMSDLRH